MANRFVIIADDLTGACDTGVQCALRGHSVRVALAERLPDDPVIVLSTDSRRDTPAEARHKVFRAWESAKKQRRRLLYKKLDSTLQGNIESEIRATMEAGAFRQAVIAPSFPAMGRRHRNFSLCGTKSVKPSEIPMLLREGRELIVAETEDDADLSRIARAVLPHKPAPLLAGSAGLAGTLFDFMFGKKQAPSFPQQAGENRPVTLFIGTTNPATLAQTRRLLSSTLNFELVDVPAGDEQFDPSPYLHNHGAFLMSGGDTAAKICRALEVKSIHLQGELTPGLPWGWIEGGAADGCVVCTKAGGFGDEKALVNAVSILSGVKDPNMRSHAPAHEF